jgi:microsomal dipeptidase-like Zn-dependent dipeptidase
VVLFNSPPIVTQLTARVRALAVFSLSAVVVLGFQGCGIEQLAPHHAVPSPPGQPVPFRCLPSLPGAAAAAAPAQPAGGGSSVGAASSPLLDDDLSNWQRDGVFKTQRVLRGALLAKDVRSWSDRDKKRIREVTGAVGERLVPLGGDYWRDTTYRIARGERTPWVSSAYAPGADSTSLMDAATGSMWRSLPLNGDVLRISVGGGTDPRVGVELLVETKGDDLTKCDDRPPEAPTARPPVPETDGFASVFVRRGLGGDVLVPYDLPLGGKCVLRGRRAVLRIFDFSPTSHVNVGDIELGADRGGDRRPHVWGFADLHTHPTSYIGFGGLQGYHTIWGAPGGDVDQYAQPGSVAAIKAMAHDTPACDDPHKRFNSHGGGFAAPIMLDVVEGRSSDDLADLTQLGQTHPSQGAPKYAEFPDFRHGAHQEYHITQLYRSYLGGLRLVSMLALQNRGLEYGTGWALCGRDGQPTAETTSDLDVVHAHVEIIRELAQKNSGWMQIAYTPEQARRIIASNKLAVILGVEVAQLGQEDGRTPAQQVDELRDLGIRQVILIHGMDNALGGPAVFVDLYNTVTDWLNRPPKYRDFVQHLSGEISRKPFGEASFFQVITDSDPAGPEPILFRFSKPRRIVLSDVFAHRSDLTNTFPVLGIDYGVLHPFLNTSPILESVQGEYDQYSGGQRNKRGLTGRGEEFLARLIERGMLVDLAHMSDASLEVAYKVAERHSCGDYPFLISHAGFRGLSFRNDYSDRADSFLKNTRDAVRPMHPISMTSCVHDPQTCNRTVREEAERAVQQSPLPGPGSLNRRFLPSEFDIATKELLEVNRRGGAVGVFLGQNPVDSDRVGTLRFANDCAGSSKSFAAALLYAQAKLPDAAVGVASDLAFGRNVVPRFGEFACAAYLDAGAGSAAGAQYLETLLNPGQYRLRDGEQQSPVRYTGSARTCGSGDATLRKVPSVPCGASEPLVPYTMGERTYDFNVDGLAHYGLVPDMLQDVANDFRSGGDTDVHMNRLFDSADAYLDMWERARAAAGCGERGGLCEVAAHLAAPIDPCACGEECPGSWNGGAPLQSVKEIYEACDAGAKIHFPARDASGPEGGPVPYSASDDKCLSPVYSQHGAHPKDHERVDLTKQGDWAIFPIRTRQLWQCGGGNPQQLNCPAEANYVLVRRVVDMTVGDVEDCNWKPLLPEVGNRRVVFQCLVGPNVPPSVGQCPAGPAAPPSSGLKSCKE